MKYTIERLNTYREITIFISAQSNINSKNIRRDVQLFTFDGSTDMWPYFWERFRFLIHEDCNIDAAEKFKILLSILEGEVKALFLDFLIAEECYLYAIDLLREKFERNSEVQVEDFSTFLEEEKVEGVELSMVKEKDVRNAVNYRKQREYSGKYYENKDNCIDKNWIYGEKGYCGKAGQNRVCGLLQKHSHNRTFLSLCRTQDKCEENADNSSKFKAKDLTRKNVSGYANFVEKGGDEFLRLFYGASSGFDYSPT